MDFKGGIVGAAVAAVSLVVLPVLLYYLIDGRYGADLTRSGEQALTAFAIYAVIVGAAVTVTMFFHGSYRRGTRQRLFLGMASGALVAAYAFVVLVASGFGSALSDIGLRLDTAFAAILVAYASVILVFRAGEEHLESKKGPSEEPTAAKAGQGNGP
jgi:Na+/proline symporter